jgi:hypothetical protein
MAKRILLFLGIIAAGILCIYLMLFLFVASMCGDEPIETYLSPDSIHEAKYFIRDCGATSGFIDHVEIDGTTVLISEAKDGKIPALHLDWISNNEISIGVSTTTTDLRVYRKPLNSYKEIEINLDPKIMSSYDAFLKRTMKK